MPKRNFSPQFKQEVAELILDHEYTQKQAAEQMGVSVVSVQRWVAQLRKERNQESPGKARALTPQAQEIQELRKQLKQAKLENEILKKASALLISGRLK